MNWTRHIIENRKASVVSFFVGILLLICLAYHQSFGSFSALIVLTLIFLDKLYLNHIGDQLFFENILQRNYFFVEETGEWILPFQNGGMPILGAKCKIFFDHVVAPLTGNEDSQHSSIEMTIPFSINKGKKKKYSIPFQTKMRGIAKIRRLEIHIESFIGLGGIILEYPLNIHQEAIVYPTPLPVKGLKEQTTILKGEVSVPLSLYEDRISPIGSRDYISTDTFNQIHWKATARKQTLQTKLYEQMAEKGWMIALNISDGYGITGNLEKLISYITEFAYFAYRNRTPYSLCVNIRTFGQTPFFNIPLGEGRTHLQNVLEGLATINSEFISFPYEKMLTYCVHQVRSQPLFLHGGTITFETNKLLSQIKRKGTTVYNLEVGNSEGYLMPFHLKKDGGVLS
ncbi:MAG: DUF58 domain-containing protein [Bacillota bacterium]|nr:DUF58 domain-containing protein [Bacillota bacterium]